MVRILSSDILIADVIIPIIDFPELMHLVEQYKLQPGGKTSLDDAQLEIFSKATSAYPLNIVPGGSSANMLTTLARIMGPDTAIRFFGVVGDGAYCDVVKAALEEVKITLMPDKSHFNHLPSLGAVSFVFVLPDGQCTIATHPGNARDVLKPAMITDHVVKHSDVLLAQGSLWHKFQPEFADRLYQLCLKHDRQLWLTLPTQSRLGAEAAEKFRHMVPDADLLLGNEGELSRIYDMPLKPALKQLQVAFKDRRRSGSGREPVGFITLGKNGAAFVTTESIEHSAPEVLRADEIINTLGAGDTAYAGFAAGHLKQLSNIKSAEIAMTLAGEKLRISNPRLPDPMKTLYSVTPELARLL